MNGSLINWDFMRWSASPYSNLEIHYIPNGGFHIGRLLCCAIPPLPLTSSRVRNAVASAYYQLDPHTNEHVSQTKMQICAFQYYFVPVTKILFDAEREILLLKEHADLY
jgi:hypothetical protein